MLTPPADGWNDMEKLFLKAMIVRMYQSIEDPLDRFILMASSESGYKQEDISEMCGISQVAISKRLIRVKAVLREQYEKVELNTE